jgi:broad specificity phosphatase PhoE
MSTPFSNPKESPQKPVIIVHFMHHAEVYTPLPHMSSHGYTNKPQAIHKQSSRPTLHLLDPELSDHGMRQAENFQDNLVTSSIPHLFSSPMTRALSTSFIAFRHFLLRGNDIIALPELQNIDIGPNGTGHNTDALQSQLSGMYSESSTKPDVWTFMCDDWNKKLGSRWGPEEVNWRIGIIKGLLKGMWLGGGKKKVEVAMVTHSSFLRQLRRESSHMAWPTDANSELCPVQDREAQITTCVFDNAGDFREIDLNKLQTLRDRR